MPWLQDDSIFLFLLPSLYDKRPLSFSIPQFSFIVLPVASVVLSVLMF